MGSLRQKIATSGDADGSRWLLWTKPTIFPQTLKEVGWIDQAVCSEMEQLSLCGPVK